MTLGEVPVVWTRKMQTAMSTLMEPEYYIAVSRAMKELNSVAGGSPCGYYPCDFPIFTLPINRECLPT